MNKTKTFLTSSLVAGAILFSVNPAFAAVRCETQYGGNEVCVTTGRLQINKEILDPRYSGTYRDNLYLTDYQFRTSDNVTFKLIVKNVGDNTLNNVKITDSLPSFLFFTGETGHEFTVEHLNPGESKEFEVKARVVSENQLVADRTCGVNTAEVWADGNEHDKDTAELCATKKVLGVTKLPETGVNTPFIIFGASLAIAVLGIALVKVGKKIA